MVGKVQERLICVLALVLAVLPLPAQSKKSGQEDSLVRLMKGTSIQLLEKWGRPFRKAMDATFLHNGMYLICDSALWDVDQKIICAGGHVKLIQGDTELTSETLDYSIDDNLAQFRGGVVQLRNKNNNVLRTRHLDYNTKDSVAVFANGGAMRDKDGQVIESMNGTYESEKKLFTFENSVNMYTDTVFVKTSRMTYESDTDKANFLTAIDFWKDGDMLSAGCGWYDKRADLFFFTRNVHGMSANQEVWCDSLYYYKAPNDVLMLGRVQMQDSTRNVAGVADYMFYQDSLARMTLRKRAAIAMETEQNGQTDTLYMGADTIIYQTIIKCDIHPDEIKDADSRLSDMMLDPVTEFRRKAAEEARKAAEEAALNDPNLAAKKKAEEMRAGKGDEGKKGSPDGPKDAPAGPVDAQEESKAVPGISAKGEFANKGLDSRDSVSSPRDSMAASRDTVAAGDAPASADTLSLVDSLAVRDSLPEVSESVLDSIPAVELDSLAIADTLARHIADSLANRDTTKVGFLWGIRNVKLFRKDMQVRCDSLRYCDLDSIARFYIEPIVWNEGNRQYTSDSLSVLIKDGGVDRASLMSNAFIITQEDTLCYDQIKGTDVMAYFDSTSALQRFDALGGASAIFYLQENDSFATVNKVESKMLSAYMTDGQLDHVFYFESPKNDAYPLAQLAKAEREMKGFNWQPELRPTGPRDITSLTIRPLERSKYSRRQRPVFKQTDIYFPGYMAKVYKDLDDIKKARRAAKNAPKALPDSVAVADTLEFGDEFAPEDTLSALADSAVAVSDTLALADSLATRTVADTLSVTSVVDSTVVGKPELSKKELAAKKRQEQKELREEARKLRIARRDARWAELDARDAAKAEAKAQKELAKKREKTKKAYLRQQENDNSDDSKLQKYIDRYQKRKERDERKQEPFPSGKCPPRIEKRGDVQAPPES